MDKPTVDKNNTKVKYLKYIIYLGVLDYSNALLISLTYLFSS